MYQDRKIQRGKEYKSSMYEMIQNILYLNKIEKSKRMYYLNKIDAILNCQRIYLRIMKNNHWIDEKKFNVDRIVHRWVVDNFLIPYFVPRFVETSYACLKNRGMHKACLNVQKAMLHCKRIWKEYYILKMDVRKYFENIKVKKLQKTIAKRYFLVYDITKCK